MAYEKNKFFRHQTTDICAFITGEKIIFRTNEPKDS